MLSNSFASPVAAGLLLLSFFNIMASAHGGPAAKDVSAKPIGFRYTLISKSSDAGTAGKLCSKQGGSLLFLSSLEELQNVTNLLSLPNNIPIWTAAIRFSNSSVSNLLSWSNTDLNFDLDLAPSSIKDLRIARAVRQKRFTHRSRRSPSKIFEVGVPVPKGNDCCCNCSCNPEPPRPPPPPPPPSCVKQTCSGFQPPCTQVGDRDCMVVRPPVCNVHNKNCSVDCGDASQCTISPPVCEVIPPSKPLCRIEEPLPQCKIVKPAKCSIVQPGACHSVVKNCTQEEHVCEPVIKPCKLPCSDQECVDTPAPCPGKKNNCPNVTRCTRPFVDCSPELCKSDVIICPPPKIHCPPPVIVCESPEVNCTEPELECPEPEVICDLPEIKCSKPKVRCPDPVVTCAPVFTTCESPQTICTDPILECPAPEISCKNSTCPGSGGGSQKPPCKDECTSCNKRLGKNELSPEVLPEVERVDQIDCISFKLVNGTVEWTAENCKNEHEFICKI